MNKILTAPMTDTSSPATSAHSVLLTQAAKVTRITYLVLLALALVAPALGLYPVFVMKLLCFALFACAFNLLLGFTGLLHRLGGGLGPCGRSVLPGHEVTQSRHCKIMGFCTRDSCTP